MGVPVTGGAAELRPIAAEGTLDWEQGEGAGD